MANKETEQNNLLLTALGLALWISQSIEYNLITLLGLAHSLGYIESDSSVKDIMNYYYQKTMGKSKNDFIMKLKIDKELSLRLDQSIVARNWLVHNFFREYGLASMSEEIRMMAYVKLKKAKNLFEDTNELLSVEISKYCKESGMSKEDMDNSNEKFLQEYYTNRQEMSKYWDEKLSKRNW